MASPEQKLDLKIRALREAVETFSITDLAQPDPVHTPDAETTAMLRRASRFYGWLAGLARVTIRIGPVVGEASDVDEPKAPAEEGDIVQINTGEKFSVTIDTRDAAGYPTDATVEWSVADETVATVVLDDGDDQKGWVISGAPGSTVLTVTVTDAPDLPPATLAIDVVPAGTATVAIATGPAVPETDPQPLPLELAVSEDTSDTTRQTASFVVDNKGEGSVTITVGDADVTISNPGDGVTASTYAYPAPGDYSASVVDDDNATRFASATVTVPFTG